MNLGRPRYEGETARYCLAISLAGVVGCKAFALLATASIDSEFEAPSPFSLLFSWTSVASAVWCGVVASGVWRRLKFDELYGYVEAWYVALVITLRMVIWWTIGFVALEFNRVRPDGREVSKDVALMLVLPFVLYCGASFLAIAVLYLIVRSRDEETASSGPLPTIQDTQRTLGDPHV